MGQQPIVIYLSDIDLFIKTERITTIKEMDRHQQAKRQTYILLGILLLTAVGVLGAKIVMEKTHPLLPPLFGSKQASLFFFLLPIGTLFKKIGARFPSKRTKESEHNISAITSFAKALPAASNKEQAVKLLIKAVHDVLNPNTINLYLYDPEAQGFKINTPKKKQGHLPDYFSLESIVVNDLQNSSGVLFYKHDAPEPQIFDGSKLKACEANLNILAPIKSQSNQLVGWLDIEPRNNDQAYLQSEIDKLELLTSLFSAVPEKFEHVQASQKQNGLPFHESDQNTLLSVANQATTKVPNASRDSETDQALEARVEELYIMQQIDRDLNATQDIDRALQRMLEAALKHTSARHGTIGLVDQYTETYENIWQLLPDEKTPNKLEDIDLSGQAWFSSEIFKDQILHNPMLASELELPSTIQWHYLVYSNLEDDQAFLLIMHIESSNNLTKGDQAFLSRLKDHGIIALKNALLYQDLSGAIQAKNEFISFISHELKNPLTVIKGYADILRKGMAGEVNEEQIDYLSTINHNVKQMDTFIKDLSDQTRIESKSLSLDFESSSVHEVINEVLNSYEALIEEKSLKVTLHIPKDIPNVWCDRMRLIQVLANLTSNAIKYTPEHGHLSLGAEHSENIWDEKGAAEIVHFWVEDNGYGIAPHDQEHLFEKFYRGSDDRKKKIPGTGLGLRIAKSLVEMMGGKIWFESTLDEGTTFHFTLPI